MAAPRPVLRPAEAPPWLYGVLALAWIALSLSFILVAGWTAQDAGFGALLTLIVLLAFAMPVELAIRRRRTSAEVAAPDPRPEHDLPSGGR